MADIARHSAVDDGSALRLRAGDDSSPISAIKERYMHDAAVLKTSGATVLTAVSGIGSSIRSHDGTFS